jgi:hypothetical protein
VILAAALASVTVLIAAGLAWTARLVHIANLDAHDQRAQPQAAGRDVTVALQLRGVRPEVSGQVGQADRAWRGCGPVPQSGTERTRRFRPSTSRRSRAVDTTSVPWQLRRLASTTPRSARSRHASRSS